MNTANGVLSYPLRYVTDWDCDTRMFEFIDDSSAIFHAGTDGGYSGIGNDNEYIMRLTTLSNPFTFGN